MSGSDGAQGMGEALILGEVDRTCKRVVIGIDFGTGYSGVAFAFRSDPTTIRCGGPTATDSTQIKVPTALLQLENGDWEFGYTAEKKYKELLLNHQAANEEGVPLKVHLYKRFKMVLKGKNEGMDTLMALSNTGKPHLLMELVTISLTKLKDYALSEVNRHNEPLYDLDDIQWVLTVPAIWTDFAKAFMRRAAFKAGLMNEEQSDNLLLVLEPEGASLAVHVGVARNSLLGANSRFIVLDCGAGTVDITAHEVVETRPLHLKSIAVPTGGDWGGDYVNVEFRKFLNELLGPELYDDQGMQREFNDIYTDFDKVKMAFDPTAEPAEIKLGEVLPTKSDLLQLATVYNAKHPEKPILITKKLEKGFLTMSNKLMLSFFEPFLLATLDETKKVMREAHGIRYIMVVGGFGSSAVLINRMRAELHNKCGIKVLVPTVSPHPQAAIMHGAVHFGLHRDIVRSRISRYTYGVAVRRNEVDEVFGVLVAKGQELPVNHVAIMTGRPVRPSQDALTWCIYRSENPAPLTVTGEHLLGSLQVACPLDDDQEKRSQKGLFFFGGSELKVKVENAKGEVFERSLSMI